MSDVQSRQLLETKDQAISVVKRLLNERDSYFELVEFEKFNNIAKLLSQHYKNYHVLCDANTLRVAGWIPCNFAKSGDCALEKALFVFKTVQGGTSRLERHTSRHKNCPGTVQFQ